MPNVRLTVNDSEVRREVEPHVLLVDLLRTHLGLTGTHVGCDSSQCGCCTVLVDGAAVKSCTMLAAQADGRSVTTIEGLGRAGAPHPIQQAFIDCHGLQCGFCTPGVLMSLKALVDNNPAPTLDDVKTAMAGNLCRCTGYSKAFKAVAAATHSP